MMWLSVAMILGYLIWAGSVWRTTPPLITEKELASEEFRYCYTTTPLRRMLVMVGSCVLFALLMWLVTFAIASSIWHEVFANWMSDHSLWRYVLGAMVMTVMVLLGRLPKVSRFLTEVCVFFQRCQFFPILPSPKEENLISQIANLPVGTLPKEIQDTLSQHPESLGGPVHLSNVYDAYQRLEVLYKELRQLAKLHKGLVKRFYFGREWELIRNQYSAIERQMNSNSGDLDEALAKKVRTCQYYCYSLLTRVIMETTSSAEESRNLFRYYGFDVHLQE